MATMRGCANVSQVKEIFLDSESGFQYIVQDLYKMDLQKLGMQLNKQLPVRVSVKILI